MGPNTFGEVLRVTTFGESHGPAVGAVLDGVPAGFELDLAAIQRELGRRRPGQSQVTTPRQEQDEVQVLSGVFEGRTTGAPLTLLVWNRDARPEAYEPLKDIYRPGHADFTVERKYGFRDWRGGGRLSGRETVARVAAGAVAKQLLASIGVTVQGAVASVGSVVGDLAAWRDLLDRSPGEALGLVEANPMRCPDPEAAARMEELVRQVQREGDSVGGTVEVRAVGAPAGWGDPVFGKMDGLLAWALMSIGGVKGVEVGAGFALAGMKGSEANDPLDPNGPRTNRCGGILGGITTGGAVVIRAAVKPTPTIAREQETVDSAGRPRLLRAAGRHDPCLCPRLVVVAEAMVALTLADRWLRQRAVDFRGPGGGGP